MHEKNEKKNWSLIFTLKHKHYTHDPITIQIIRDIPLIKWKQKIQ